MSDLAPDTTAKVFAAACDATYRNTNLGLTAEVSVDGYTYRVILGERLLAYTDCRFGWGGTEHSFASATPDQDRAIRHAIAHRSRIRGGLAPSPSASPNRRR